MIDLYYWTTTNPHKVTILLEEVGAEYQLLPVNISRGDQFKPDFLRISPNNKVPAIVDHAPPWGGTPMTLFESGAILVYLAQKFGRFLPEAVRPRYQVLQWLCWQMGGLGPIAGQNHHFNQYAPYPIPYAIERFVNDTKRLYTVLDRQLANSDWIAGEYSIADMAVYPWIVPHARSKQIMTDFPHVERWFHLMRARPAVERAYALAESVNLAPIVTEAARPILFGQVAATAEKFVSRV